MYEDDTNPDHYWIDVEDGEIFHQNQRPWHVRNHTPERLRAKGYKLFSEATATELLLALIEAGESLRRAQDY